VCHRIVAAGKLALVCHEYLKKGRQVFVEGRLRYGEWDTSDGRKQHRTEIVAARVQFLGPPPQEASQSAEPDSPAWPSDSDIPS
jgi:single-strand DNA-binding protein